ncbi:hypothetical protein Gotur_028640, partial [Gossypium turneri]
MTSEAVEIMEKLKDKKVEYEAIALSDGSIHLDNIDNQIIIEVLGPERYGRMQASTDERIAQLKVEAERKYEELQLQLKAEAAAREVEQSKKYDALQLQLQNM